MARPTSIKFSIKEKNILKKHYSALWKYDLMDLIPNYNWHQIQFQANKLGLSKPNIRTSKLKFLLEDNLINYYWYGFIMADGHLSESNALIISLNKKDLNHLEKISSKIGCNILTSTKNDMVTINVMDKINVQLLKEKLDINNNKTYNPPSIDKLNNLLDNKEKFLAFMIGMVDGDGNITYQKNSTTFKSLRMHIHVSWIDVLEYFSLKLYKYYDINTSFSICKRGYAQFNLCSIKNYTIIKKFIIKNNLPVLKRKWL